MRHKLRARDEEGARMPVVQVLSEQARQVEVHVYRGVAQRHRDRAAQQRAALQEISRGNTPPHERRRSNRTA